MNWITLILLLLSLPMAAMATPNPVTAPAVATTQKETVKAPMAPELTAEQRQAKAKGLYSEAVKAYKKGEFLEALKLFTKADELDPSESLKWNKARTQHAMKRWDESIKGFEGWLSANPNAPPADRQTAESLLTEAKAQKARAEKLAAARKARQEELARAKAAMRPTPTKTEPTPSDQPSGKPTTRMAADFGPTAFYERAPSWRSYTALGFAVGGLVLGIQAGDEVHYAERGIEIAKDNRAITREGEYRDYADQQQKLQIAGYALLGVGITYALVDWIWLNEPDRSLAVVPTANDKGSAGAAMFWRF